MSARKPMTGEQVDAVLAVLHEVRLERFRQHAKWGEQNLPSFGTDAPSDEQLYDLEMARAYVDLAATGKFPLSYHSILFEEFLEAVCERDPAKLRAELVQVAAVAVQWIEAIDRRGGR